jgi:hypothetical protein
MPYAPEISMRHLILALLAAPLAAQTAAPAHPDLAGTWVLDASKSTVDGPLPLPTAATYVVGMHGDSITVAVKSTDPMAGDVTLNRLLATDGYSWTNYMSYQGTQMTLNSVAKWNGAVLAVATNSDFAGTAVVQNETWTLGADGKTLSIATTTNVAGAYFAAQTLVFTRK